MKTIYSLTLLLFISLAATAQNVGINTPTPDASASLEVGGTDKGLLVPAVSLTGATDITTVTDAPYPARLLIYNNATAGTAPNAVTPGYYFWNGTQWIRLVDGATSFGDHDWYEVGTTDAPNSITDNIFTQGTVQIDNDPATLYINNTGTTGYASVIFRRSGTNGAFMGHWGTAVNNTTYPGAISNDLLIGNFSGGGIGFTAGPTFAPVVRMLANGNVGIGNTDPQSKLHVSGGLAIGDGAAISTTHGASRSIQISTDLAAYGGTYDNHSGFLMYATMPGGWGTSKLHFAGSTDWRTYNTTTPAMTISIAGVGIGTASPGAALEVAGQVKITGGTPGAGQVLTSDASGLATWETPATGSSVDKTTFNQATTTVFYTDAYISFRWNSSTDDFEMQPKAGHTGWWDQFYLSEWHEGSSYQTPHSGANDFNLSSSSTWYAVDSDLFNTANTFGPGAIMYVMKEDSDAYPTYKIVMLRHGDFTTSLVEVYP